MNKTFLAITLASLLTPISYVHAQEANNVTPDETMVVTSRSNNVNSIIEIPANITLITKGEIEQSGAKSIESLLRGKAGIQVSDSNSGAAFSIRGFSGEQAASNTLILLDGRKLNNQDLVAPNLSFIQLKDVERIEILSGSAGVLYGDQAVGGVINIITTNSQRDSTNISTSYGSFNSTNMNVSKSGSINKELSYRLSATQDNSDNYRDHNASRNGSLLSRLDYQNESRKMFFELGYYDTRRELAGSLTEQQYKDDPTQANTSYPDDYTHDISITNRIGYSQILNSRWNINNELQIDETNGNGVAYGNPVETKSSLLAFSSSLERHVTKKNNFIIGVDLANNGYAYESSFTDRDNEQRTISVFSQYQYFISPKLILSVGGRYAEVQDKLKDQATYTTRKTLNSDATAFEGAVNYQLDKHSKLYAKIGSNYRFAKASELAYTEKGAVGLKPQKGLSSELGWNANYTDYSVKIDLFHLDLTDEIIYDPTVPGPLGGHGANTNGPDSSRDGASISGVYYVLSDLQLLANYSFVDAKYTDGIHDGKNVAWVAKHTGSLGAIYDINDFWNVNLNGVYTGSKYRDGDITNSQDKVKAYWLTDLSVNYKIDDLTLNARVENLFNQKYASYVYYSGFYSGNERAMYVSANYQF